MVRCSVVDSNVYRMSTVTGLKRILCTSVFALAFEFFDIYSITFQNKMSCRRAIAFCSRLLSTLM